MGLLRPAWRSKDPKKAARAVQKITDPTVLEGIALADVALPVKEAAVGRLSDQAALERIVRAKDWDLVRVMAVRKLTDPAVLADLGLHDDSYSVRDAALERVPADELARIAMNDSGDGACVVVHYLPPDAAVLADVALHGATESTRYLAAKRLTSLDENSVADSHIERVVTQSDEFFVYLRAMSGVTSPSALERIARDSAAGAEKRLWAVRGLTDPAYAADVYGEQLRIAGDELHRWLSSGWDGIEYADEDGLVERVLIELLQIAQGDVRIRVLRDKLVQDVLEDYVLLTDDQTLLSFIAKYAKSIAVRDVAADRVIDPLKRDTLRKITDRCREGSHELRFLYQTEWSDLGGSGAIDHSECVYCGIVEARAGDARTGESMTDFR